MAAWWPQAKASRTGPIYLARLHQDGYDGFFSLEPHLASAGKYQGFSGPDLFHTASQALQTMLGEMGWTWE